MRPKRDCHYAQEPKDGRYACGTFLTATSTMTEDREKVTCRRCTRSGQTYAAVLQKRPRVQNRNPVHWVPAPGATQYPCGVGVDPTRLSSTLASALTCGRCIRFGNTPEQRFWKKVNKDGPNKIGTPCWLWVGALQQNGYGSFWLNRTSIGAHRYSYNLHNGVTLPSHLCACHKCDTPLCVNPEHLFAGTHDDNAKDMAKKQRAPNWDKRAPKENKPLALEMLRGDFTRDEIVAATGFNLNTLRNWYRQGQHLLKRDVRNGK